MNLAWACPFKLQETQVTATEHTQRHNTSQVETNIISVHILSDILVTLLPQGCPIKQKNNPGNFFQNLIVSKIIIYDTLIEPENIIRYTLI